MAETNDINLQKLLEAEQARCLASLGAAHTNVMDLQQRVSLNKWDELDPRQAEALKAASQSRMGYDLASIRPPALPATS